MAQFPILNSQFSIRLLPWQKANLGSFTLKNPDLTPLIWAGIMTLFVGNALADLAVQHVEIAPRAPASRVPEAAARNRFLAPQAIAAVDVSADGKIITVGTMAFSHDANAWQFGAEGVVVARRHFPPWAPIQVATLPGGGAMAVGLAYSRPNGAEFLARLVQQTEQSLGLIAVPDGARPD